MTASPRRPRNWIVALTPLLAGGALLVAACTPPQSDTAKVDPGAEQAAPPEAESGAPADPPVAGSQETAPDAPPAAGQAASKVTLVDAAPEQLKALIAKHAAEGKVVLVDYWATWCAPCKVKFPHIVELAKKHREAGLVAISMSCDAAEQRGDVLEFLQQKHAVFDNLLTTLDINATFDAYEIPEGIPFYQLYDRKGQLRYRFSGVADEEAKLETFDAIDQRVAELLAEK